MKLKDKLPSMSEEEQLSLLATNGMLAIEFYAPLFLLINMFDKTGEKEDLAEIFSNHTKRFMKNHAIESGGEK